MVEVGKLCVKLAGRDAGKKCVVVEVLDKNFVMVDGETRRRKCNIIHLEPLGEKLKIKSKASHDSVVKAFKEIGIEIKESKKKQAAARPKKARKEKKKPEEALAKKVEKEGKKAEPKAEKKKESPKEKKEEEPEAKK